VDRSADLTSEYAVHEAVLLNPRQPGEGGSPDRGAKVIAAASPILDLSLSPRDRSLDA